MVFPIYTQQLALELQMNGGGRLLDEAGRKLAGYIDYIGFQENLFVKQIYFGMLHGYIKNPKFSPESKIQLFSAFPFLVYNNPLVERHFCCARIFGDLIQVVTTDVMDQVTCATFPWKIGMNTELKLEVARVGRDTYNLPFTVDSPLLGCLPSQERLLNLAEQTPNNAYFEIIGVPTEFGIVREGIGVNLESE